MKKLVLSLFLSIIGFIGFSSAYVIKETVTVSNSPTRYSLTDNGFTNTITIIQGSNCTIYNGYYSYEIDNGSCTSSCTFNSDTFSQNNNNLQLRCGSASKFVISYDNGQPAPVVEGGSSNITPVITGLFGVYGELIPYVVYIGIGVLIVTLGFYAIRRLVNWLSDKIHNNFKF